MGGYPVPEPRPPAMRVLFVSPVPTHPPVAGNRSRVQRIAADLRAAGHEAHLLFVPDAPADLDAMRLWWEDRLRVAPNPRPPFRNPLRFRLLDRLTFGQVMGPRFQYLSDIDAFISAQLEERVAQVARELAPDAVIVTYPFYSRLLELFDGRTFKLLDSQDRFSRRHWLQWRHRLRSRFVTMAARQERRALERADLVLAIQEEERSAFGRLAATPVVVLGHRVDLQRLAPADGATRLGFVGSDNGPNVRGMNWFMRRVLPGLRRRFADLELLLAGPICTCPGLRPVPGVRLLGTIDDLVKLYEQVHVAVNPAFAGSGLHVKNLEILGYGRPLVMTPSAARGIRDGAGRAYRVARSARDFQREIARLLVDRDAAERLAGEAFAFARRYDERARDQVGAILARAEAFHRPA